MILNGTLTGIDNYKKIKLLVSDTTVIDELQYQMDERYTCPYRIIGAYLECLIIINSHSDYYTKLVNENINKEATIDIAFKRYSFNGKRGTSLILQSLTIN